MKEDSDMEEGNITKRKRPTNVFFAGDSAGHRYNVGCRIGYMRLSGRFSLQENFFAPFLGM